MMPAGRPTELTKAISRRIVAALKRSWHLETAAKSVGFDRTYVWKWIRSGRLAKKKLDKGKPISEQDEIFVEFCNAYEKELAKIEGDTIAQVQLAGQEPRNWMALMRLAEVRWPDRWAKKDSLEIAKLLAQVEELRKAIMKEKQ